MARAIKRRNRQGLSGLTVAQQRSLNAKAFRANRTPALGNWWDDLIKGTEQVTSNVINAISTGTQAATKAVVTVTEQVATNVANAATAVFTQKDNAQQVALLNTKDVSTTAQNAIDNANKTIVKIAGPELNAISILLGLTGKNQTMLTTEPLDFFLHFFDPMIDYCHQMVDRVTARTGKIQRKLHPLTTKTWDMRTVQPQDAQFQKNDPGTFDYYWTLRLIGQFISVILTCPVICADEAIKMLLNQPHGTDKNWDLGIVGVDDVFTAGAATPIEATTVAATVGPAAVEGIAATISALAAALGIPAAVSAPVIAIVATAAPIIATVAPIVANVSKNFTTAPATTAVVAPVSTPVFTAPTPVVVSGPSPALMVGGGLALVGLLLVLTAKGKK